MFKEHSIVGNARIFSFGRVGYARILSFGTYKKGTLDWSGMESSAQNHHQASSIHYLLQSKQTKPNLIDIPIIATIRPGQVTKRKPRHENSK